MTKKNVFDKLNNIFRDVFDDETIIVEEDTFSDDIQGWDSIEHIRLIIAIEEEFHIKFSVNEVLSMKNVGEMVDVILTKGL